MATFTPLGDPEHPYLTVPIDGILPKEVVGFAGEEQSGEAHIAALMLKDGQHLSVMCLPHSVVLISPVPFRAIGIENDRLSGGQRVIWHVGQGEKSSITVRALVEQPPVQVPGNWTNIDDRLGLIITGSGFNYTPAGAYTQKGVAADRVAPATDAQVWQIVPQVNHEQTAEIAKTLPEKITDGAGGRTYSMADAR
jgi:hypothetical protein